VAAPSQGGSYPVRFSGDQRPFTAGQTIFAVGDPGDVMYVVKEGEVEVLVRDRVVETIGPGGILGEMALIDHSPRSASARAKTDCQLVPIDEARFKFMIQQTPFFAIEVMRVMTRRLRHMNAEP
jgi:CRP/FNR family cyclic AMP-dependent transcriptional regulator